MPGNKIGPLNVHQGQAAVRRRPAYPTPDAGPKSPSMSSPMNAPWAASRCCHEGEIKWKVIIVEDEFLAQQELTG